MNNSPKETTTRAPESDTPLWLVPLKMVAWPFLFLGRVLWRNWLSYVFGSVLRDENRVYSIKFIWYGETVYLHPLVWGSLVLFFVAKSNLFAPGWPLLIWFSMLIICFLTVMYNFDIFKAGVLLISLIAVFGLAYISNMEWHLNPLRGLARHIQHLEATVSPGFYVIACYVFAVLIAAEVAWAWLFNRVELDESYVYEHKFLKSTTREPIFARGLKRETRDLLELLILGAGDIEHRTKTGSKRFKNVPGASLGLGRAIDSMLDYRRDDEIAAGRKGRRDEDDQSQLSDAMHDLYDDTDDVGDDDGGADTGG
jgi:hypothetical protein